MTQIRGVFPLPKTNPQDTGVDQEVCLAPGGVYVIPPGNFLCHTGEVTILQWFDPQATIWRCHVPARSFHRLNSDGTNFRLLNFSGVVASCTITAPGSGGIDGIGPEETGETVLTFSLPGSPNGLAAQGYCIIGGQVPKPQLVQGGRDFAVPPLICCDPPPVGGRQARFVAVIEPVHGVITDIIVVDPGAGYHARPRFYVIPQPRFYQGMPKWPLGRPVTPPWPALGTINPHNVWPGTLYQANIQESGALIHSLPLIGSGTLTGVKIIFNGCGYDGAIPPTATITSTTLTGATVTVVPAFSVPGPTLALGGTSTAGAPVTLASPGPGGTPAQGVFADAAGNVTITNPGFALPGIPLGPAGPIPGAGAGGVNDTSILQAQVN